MYRLSEPEPLSSLAVRGCGVGNRSAGARAYLGPRPLWPVTRWLMGRSAGDDSGRSVFLGAPLALGGSRDTFGSGPEGTTAWHWRANGRSTAHGKRHGPGTGRAAGLE